MKRSCYLHLTRMLRQASASKEPVLRVVERQQDLRWRARDRKHRFRSLCRRSARAGRRERRRQVDAVQGHRRRHQADLGRVLRRRQAGQFRAAARCARRRHLHGLPGNQPGADNDRGAEHRTRQREADHPLPEAQYPGAAAPAIPQLPHRPCDAGRRCSAPPSGRWWRSPAPSINNARIIIFDEPTASLTPEEIVHFFNLVRDLRARGVAIIYISHALEECVADLRSHHGIARRQAGDHRQDLGDDPREAGAPHGWPRHHANPLRARGGGARRAPSHHAARRY